MQDLESQFRKLNVNLAKTKNTRRPIPTKKAHTWCSHCGKEGHYPHDCPNLKKSAPVKLVSHTYFTESQESEAKSGNPVFANCYVVQPHAHYFPRAQSQSFVCQQMPMANPNQSIYKPHMGPPGEYPPRRAPKEKGGYYNCGSKDHYSPSCPYPK
jgi:hypothetical protein